MKLVLPLKDPGLLREKCYVNGQWVGQGSIAVTDPATGEQLALVPDADADQTRMAIAAASAAMPDWKALLAAERARILRRWFELVMAIPAARRDELVFSPSRGRRIGGPAGER